MYETTEAKERRDRAKGKTSRRGKQLGKRWVLEVLVCLSLLSFVISFLCGAVRWGGGISFLLVCERREGPSMGFGRCA